MHMMMNTPHGAENGMMNGMMQMAPWIGVLWMLLMLAVLVLAVLGVVWLVRNLRDGGKRESDNALETLRERYARGEIDEEEYRARRKELQS
jgi:putative membrane protein